MAQLSSRVRALMQPHLRELDVYDPNFTPTRINLSANENTDDVPATSCSTTSCWPLAAPGAPS